MAHLGNLELRALPNLDAGATSEHKNGVAEAVMASLSHPFYYKEGSLWVACLRGLRRRFWGFRYAQLGNLLDDVKRVRGAAG